MTRRRIVDAHHHLWDLGTGYRYPWLQDKPSGGGMLGDLTPIVRDYLPVDYRADSAGYDVIKTVHLEAVPMDPLGETRWLSEITAGHAMADAIVAHAALNAPEVEALLSAQAAFPKVRGVRQIVNWHPNPALTFTDHDLLADDTWRAGFALLKKYGLSFDLQLYPGQMPTAAALAREHPETLLIVNHTGMPLARQPNGVSEWRTGMQRLAAEDNVVAKISGLGMVDHQWNEASIRPFVLDTIDIFGVDRCMFGSNFPVDRLYSSFTTLYRAFESIVADFSPDEQAKLFHDNALRTYRL